MLYRLYLKGDHLWNLIIEDVGSSESRNLRSRNLRSRLDHLTD